MSESQERKLSFTQNLSLGAHTMMCKGCRNYKQQMGTIRLMMRTYAEGGSEESSKKAP